MKLINYPTSHCKRHAANNCNTAVAAIGVLHNERCHSSAATTRVVATKSRDGGARHFPSPLPSLSPPRSSLVCQLVVALMPPPLILLTLPPPLNAQPWPIKALSPLVRWCLSSHLPLICLLVVALPVVACLCFASLFAMQPPHAFILDPPSLFAPSGCCHASLCISSTSRRAPASRLAVCCHCRIAGVVVVDAQRSLHHRNCDCHPRCFSSSWHCRPCLHHCC